MNTKINIILAAAALAAHAASADVIVATDAYTWSGDTIRQAEYMATAPSPPLMSTRRPSAASVSYTQLTLTTIA